MKQLIRLPLKHILYNQGLMESLMTEEDEAGIPLFSILFNPMEFGEVKVLTEEERQAQGIISKGDDFFINNIKKNISKPIFKQEVKAGRQVLIFTLYRTVGGGSSLNACFGDYMTATLEVGGKIRYFYGVLNRQVELMVEV